MKTYYTFNSKKELLEFIYQYHIQETSDEILKLREKARKYNSERMSNHLYKKARELEIKQTGIIEIYNIIKDSELNIESEEQKLQLKKARAKAYKELFSPNNI